MTVLSSVITTEDYQYTNLRFVCESVGQSVTGTTEAIRPALSSFLSLQVSGLDTFLHCLDKNRSEQTKVSRFERRRDRIRLKKGYVRRPGDGKRARFWSRCCPQVLLRRRRFYSQRFSFGALASEAVRQLSSLSG